MCLTVPGADQQIPIRLSVSCTVVRTSTVCAFLLPLVIGMNHSSPLMIFILSALSLGIGSISVSACPNMIVELSPPTLLGAHFCWSHPSCWISPWYLLVGRPWGARAAPCDVPRLSDGSCGALGGRGAHLVSRAFRAHAGGLANQGLQRRWATNSLGSWGESWLITSSYKLGCRL